MRRVLLTFGGVFLGLAVLVAVILFVLVRVLAEPLPVGAAGAPADLLLERIEQAVGMPAYRNTAAVAFTFRGINRHFADLRRGFWEVRWQEDGGEWAVQRHEKSGSTLVLRDENPLPEGPQRTEVALHAYRSQVNDAFWFHPFQALRAPGVERRLVGERALLVTFTSGGLTPGDSYLFVTDRSFRPEAVRMWVQVLPLRGMRFTFEDWKKTETGFFVSLVRRSNLAEVKLSDVRAYEAYPEPGQPDRFAYLMRTMESSSLRKRK